MDCLFCKIARGEIPSKVAYEDERVYAFYDISPQAPTHILVIPRVHVESADCITEENAETVSAIFTAIPKIARAKGLGDGYRVITNVGENGRQSVKHMHFHVLGGAKLPEEMGV